MYTVVCPSSAGCYAGGTMVSSGPTFATTLTDISASGVPGTTQVGGAGQILSMACVSATVCYAAVASSGGGSVEVVTNGVAGTSFPLSSEGDAIACFQAVTCFVAGNTVGDKAIDVSPVNPVTGQPGTAQTIAGMTQISALVCATATECIAVGYSRHGKKLASAVSDIDNGTAGKAKKASGQDLSGVACSTATTCWAIGENSSGTAIVEKVKLG
jgi:hypothetical protein